MQVACVLATKDDYKLNALTTLWISRPG